MARLTTVRCAAAAGAATILCAAAGADTLTVDNENPLPPNFATIQSAIVAALPGDRIEVYNGPYDEHINLLGKNITLIAPSGAVEIRALQQTTAPVITVPDGHTSATTIENFIVDGSADGHEGSGIYIYDDSAPVVRGCTFRLLEADNGAGAYLEPNTAPAFESCVFQNNTGDLGGGMYADSANPTVTGCEFTSNLAVYGGGIYGNGGDLYLDATDFTSNRAAWGGGAVWAQVNGGGVLTIRGRSDFVGNFLDPLFALLDPKGGAVFVTGPGSGAAAAGTFDLSSATFDSNTADGMNGVGGAVYAVDLASVDITSVEFTSNSAETAGGALYLGDAAVDASVRYSRFELNSSAFGGGLYAEDIDPEHAMPLSTERNLFVDNSAYSGGAMYINGGQTVDIIRSRFFRDHAGDRGGAVYVENVPLNVVNSIIVGADAEYGPALAALGSATLTNSSIATCTANTGFGAIFVDNGATLTVRNAIVYHNSPPEWIDLSSGIVDAEYSDLEGFFIWPGFGNINLPPLFEDITPGAENLRLQSGSPACDSGDSTAPGIINESSDLDGESRFQDDLAIDTGVPHPVHLTVVDMGAYEVQEPVDCAADLNGDGILDNADIQFFVFYFLGGDPAADLNGDGILDNGDIFVFITLFLGGC